MFTDEENRQSEFESFFITIFDSKTSKQTSYLKLPSNNCFTYCVKEIIHTLRNEESNSKISDHSSKLIANFYSFMLNDTILKNIDVLAYSRILLSLKTYSENNSTNVSEKLAFFENIEAQYARRYRNNVYETLKSLADNNTVDQHAYDIISLFINELLASGINYLFLTYSMKLFKQSKFENFFAFIDYIFYANGDSFDILIPIKGVQEKEYTLFQLKEQKLEIQNEITYCKVYGNKIVDFFFLIKENMIRIESLFNILRLFRNSEIDFLREEDILVQSKYFNETFRVKFDDINRYSGPNPYFKNLKTAVSSLDKLKEQDRDSYHSVLNMISYAEKDKDYMNASSFVDNWIALESLASLSGRRTGYASVDFIIPKMLVAKIILSDATNTLENAYRNYLGTPMKLETFIKLVCEESFDFSKIKNPYYRLEIKKLASIFSDTRKLQDEFLRVEKILSLDLLRIYMLRNEYVHASNLQAFNSMQHIKIKHILPLCIDAFFKQLNLQINKGASSGGVIHDVFSNIISRNEIRAVSFRLLNEKVRLANGKVILDAPITSFGITLDTYIFNVLKNNVELFRKYVESED